MGLYKKLKHLAEGENNPEAKKLLNQMYQTNGDCSSCGGIFPLSKLDSIHEGSGDLFCKSCGEELKQLFGEG